MKRLGQRQSLLLHLIDRSAGSLDRLRLMRLAFLAHDQGADCGTDGYRFVPHRHGPFSFMLEYDVRKLVAANVLVLESGCLRLCNRDLPGLEPAERARIDVLWERYGSSSTSWLLNHIGTNAPWFTANLADPAQRRSRLPSVACAIYTAGYARLSVDEFADRLMRCGIRSVIDVRANPIARRYGFHRSSLLRNLDSLGIGYAHLPELGIAAEERAGLTRAADYERLFAAYESDTLPLHKPAVARVAALLGTVPSVLLCREEDPCQCHRSRLGRVIAVDTGLPMLDLGQLRATRPA